MIERDVDKFAVALKPLLISPSRPQPEPVTAQPQPDVGRLVEALERIADPEYGFHGADSIAAQALAAYRQPQPSTTREPQS